MLTYTRRNGFLCDLKLFEKNHTNYTREMDDKPEDFWITLYLRFLAGWGSVCVFTCEWIAGNVFPPSNQILLFKTGSLHQKWSSITALLNKKKGPSFIRSRMHIKLMGNTHAHGQTLARTHGHNKQYISTREK